MTGLLKLPHFCLQTWSSENLQSWLPTFPAMPAFSLRLIGNFFIASQVVVHLDASEQSRNIDILNYVDPLIGTTEGGEM